MTSKNSHIPISSEESDWIASLLPIGFILGYLVNPFIIDRVNRKLTLLIFAIPQIIAWLLITLANNSILIYISRIIGGIGYGGGICAASIYLSEIGNRKNRGIFLEFNLLSQYVGNLYTKFLGAHLSYFYMNLCLLIIPIVFVIAFSIMPDSSYFLETNNESEVKIRRARTSTEFAEEEEDKSGRGAVKREDKKIEVIEIEERVILTKPKKFNFKETKFWKLLAFRNNLRAMLILTILAALSAFSGDIILNSFTQQIFSYSEILLKAETSTIILAIMQLCAASISTQLVERIKRKIILLYTGIFGTIGLGFVAIFFLLEKKVDVSSISWFPLFGIIVYEFMFTIGGLNFFYLYQGELFMNDVKSLAIPFSKILYMMFTFLAIFRFQGLIEFMGPHVIFFSFAIFCAIGTYIVLSITPETKGKRLVEVQEMLKEGKYFFGNFNYCKRVF